ncbi:YiaA/YiaB family inner membrane protein [Acanthopleuribacter pedis]|uniref:YiaAB two helix domain-containing protein n=1 Tax=Acanthopleuribacter pedis TaxID=442870 RepID=A0A8J7QAA7_9BACT|nr:YiaA/YiaB family inner membrane protein [Acanthopleuribacter pedis]MBO1320727.1 hypothetical protein [Acanthopleuribacter pedis]
MMNGQDPSIYNQNSQGWVFFVKAAFVLSLVAMGVATVFLPVTVWIKGYLAMGSLMMVTTSIMLSKTMRDEFEAKKLLNRINEARTEQFLKDVDRAA